ncbi:hypothetical protein ACIGCK_08845 [Microbacterium sp. NPDC078428]|uniref:hypothetical protein n=1 Tax=Microbacterium sp. NPDC078428 TaxID=3364190 RepID=UPI0037C69480
MLKRATAVCIAAGILAFAPTTAHAETGEYAQPSGVTIESPVIEPCETATVVFGARYWGSGEPISVTAQGARAGAATFDPAVTAAEDGSLVAAFSPPSDGVGVYQLTFAGASGNYTATVSVTDPVLCEVDPGVALASTGGGVESWLIAGGAGLVAIGSGAVIVASRRRAAGS